MGQEKFSTEYKKSCPKANTLLGQDTITLRYHPAWHSIRAIYETVENNQIYYTDQWELIKTYQTPTTANYSEALEMLISELFSIIAVEEIEEELDEEELGEDEDER